MTEAKEQSGISSRGLREINKLFPEFWTFSHHVVLGSLNALSKPIPGNPKAFRPDMKGCTIKGDGFELIFVKEAINKSGVQKEQEDMLVVQDTKTRLVLAGNETRGFQAIAYSSMPEGTELKEASPLVKKAVGFLEELEGRCRDVGAFKSNLEPSASGVSERQITGLEEQFGLVFTKPYEEELDLSSYRLSAANNIIISQRSTEWIPAPP